MLVGLGDLDVLGVLELAQVRREVAGGHVEQLLQPGEGDLVAGPQPGEGDGDPQPRLGVDDRVELGQFAHQQPVFFSRAK